MNCFHCGKDIGTLEDLEAMCRTDFDSLYGEHFNMLENTSKKKVFWRGFWIGVGIDAVMLFVLIVVGGWSWSGVSELLLRIQEKSSIVVFFLFVLPFVFAMTGSMFASAGVRDEEEHAYERFKKTWNAPKEG